VRGADRITLVPDEGKAHGHIVYRERIRPVLRLDRLLAAELGELAAQARHVAVVTDEGEHAVHVTAVSPDGAVRHDVGLVFVDDFYARVRGTCDEPTEHERFGALMRKLIVGDSHGMTRRRRRYYYTPPPGWQALARGLETHWFPPDYPRNRSTISVPPASQGVLDPVTVLQARLALDATAGFAATDVRPAEPIATSSANLAGVSFLVTGVFDRKTPFVRELAVLFDHRCTYPLLFDSAGGAAEHTAARRCFGDLVRSVRPLPAPSEERREIMNLWSD
jgi:hypothetical protein